MKQAKYDVGGTMYLDWITQMPTDDLIKHFESTETPMVSTNMDFPQNHTLVSGTVVLVMRAIRESVLNRTQPGLFAVPSAVSMFPSRP